VNILVTGGAGFVGSTIALALRRALTASRIVALDNLYRQGSELNLPRLQAEGIEFRYGDIRVPGDFPAEKFDLLVECSADPSVLSGYHSSPGYLLSTNVAGAMHCLEFCRQRQCAMIFLSTSRIYPVEALSNLRLIETETRFETQKVQNVPGAGPEGISEDFPLAGHRSLYGASKLAAELLIEEFRVAYGLPMVINRCGVLAGPWQMARPDQGIFTYWLAQHWWERPLRYIGFGGRGKQVRDLLHAEDLAELVVEQAQNLSRWNGACLNVSGGRAVSLSLAETTLLCQKLTGKTVPIVCEPNPRPMDIPVYIGDCGRLHTRTSWRPHHTAEQILEDTLRWIRGNEAALQPLL
jgi:CDP-paratose 2-epimerase